ncbi:Gamma-tubulin complex component, partial [Globisporangium splendens]
MNSERENARLKRRSDPPLGDSSSSSSNNSNSNSTADASSQYSRPVPTARSLSAAVGGYGSSSNADLNLPPPPPPPPSSSRHHQHSGFTSNNQLSGNALAMQRMRVDDARSFAHVTSRTTSSANAAGGIYGRSSVLNVSTKPPTPPSASSRASSRASTTSAAAVSISSRRSTSSSKSPRDTSVLIDKLLTAVHGAPSAITTRRAVIRLSDATAEVNVDSLTILEKMKRKIGANEASHYEKPHETIAKLHELYSRFVKIKNVNKKNEMLLVLYGLMDSVPPPGYQEGVISNRPEFTTLSMDKLVPTAAPQTAASSSSNERSASATSHSVDANANANPSHVAKTRTEVDSLEDSFKFAVGIASSSQKSARSKATASRTPPNGKFGSASSFEVPEEVLLRDVLYALQAIDSRYLYFDASADRFQITRSVGVPTPMRELIHKLCELGWFYRKISEYLKHHREELSFGVVGQSFCHVLNIELSDYFRLIAVLASQVDDDAETKQPNERSFSELTLRKLLVWTQDPLDKMRLMARLIDSVEGLRGGALASGVHSHILHGDPAVSRYVQNVMKRVAAPIFRMIRRWVFEGELEDPHWIMDAGQDLMSGTADDEDDGVHFAELINLEIMIEKVSKTTNEYLIRTLNEKYQLVDHCRALKRYLLLGQTTDILARLDVELLQASTGDSGWDIFSLHYKLTSPVNTVINDATMAQYQRIFHFLWRLKRVEHALSGSWSKDMNLGHMIQGRLPNIVPIIHKCQLLRSEMIHFTSNLHNYMMFEVLETSWHKLVKDLKAAKDLDELIESHEEYIAAIKKNGFMAKDSRELLTQLKLIFDTIIMFSKTQENLYTTALREVHEEKMRQQAIEKRTLEGTWGTSEVEADAERKRNNTFGPNSKIVRQIEDIVNNFSTQLLGLLEMIRERAAGGSQGLSFLISQFDFNEYYRSKTNPSMDTDE